MYVELLVGAFQHQANSLHCNYSLPTASGFGAGFKMGDSDVPMPEVDGVDAARLASEERDRKALMASEEGQKLLKEMVEASELLSKQLSARLVRLVLSVCLCDCMVCCVPCLCDCVVCSCVLCAMSV